MKIVLQAFEPQPQPAAASFEPTVTRTAPRRSRKIRLMPVVADTRLFHAL